MAKSKKPTVRFYWADQDGEQRVNWALIGANGETICQSTQGHRDRTDAVRAVDTAIVLLGAARRSGPGPKHGEGELVAAAWANKQEGLLP